MRIVDVVELSRSRRFGVFSLVGSTGFVIQMAALVVLTRIVGWPSPLATFVAIELAIFNNFFAHARWTWADRRPSTPRDWWSSWARYQATKSVVAAVNMALTAAIVAATRAPLELANAGAVLLCSVLGFTLSDRLIFMDNRRAGPESR